MDNDCDGEIDQGIAPIPASLTAGVCAGQVSQCVNGTFQEPDYTLIPFYEEGNEITCDGMDNNCKNYYWSDF